MKRNILNINKGKIEVYSFEPIHYKLDLFRLDELKTIPKEEQILRKENTRGWLTPREGVIYECDNYIIRQYPFKKMADHDNWLRTRRSYTHGLYSRDPATEYESGLITLNPINGYSKDIIQLTQDAYIEYLLENEMFSADFLEDKDLSKMKELFKISDKPIDEVSIEELKKICENQIVKDLFNYRMERIERESSILRQLKK